MSPCLPSLVAAALLAASPAPSSAPPAQPPASSGEAALVKCWAKEVTSVCMELEKDGDAAAFEACKAERGKTACAAERAAYEKELAATMASDALDLLASSIKRVCLAEAAALSAGKLRPEQETALAAGWREALDVRSVYMHGCERTGRDARDCDEAANQAERRARAEFCPTGK